ncbi:MAG: TIGR01777 family oxidoreductase [Fimbriimonadaceae bacterium]|nr:TIGR01777 family oxidoreductase [Fimbriimonadaceae bacterium]QYK55600.1 MAG: TIGR01777 family oxidoreductase [Fimbriimonadaceae bacterium]
MKKVVIAGGSGFIGSALVELLADHGFEVAVLSRSTKSVKRAKVVQWDGRNVEASWSAELEGATAVVNLAGAPLMARWNEGYKKKLASSRVEPTRAIGEAIGQCIHPPKVWINGSAIGFYGDTGSREVSEASPPGKDFLAETCQQWENAALEAVTPNTRKVLLRTGIVLGRGGGSFELFAKLTKAFLGSALGNGRQYVSWIHLKDMVGMLLWAIEGEATGPVNAVAPRPVTNSELMAAFRAEFGRPPMPNVPEFMVNAVAGLQGWPPEMLLGGQRVVPAMALARGYRFHFEDLPEALADLDTEPPGWAVPAETDTPS